MLKIRKNIVAVLMVFCWQLILFVLLGIYQAELEYIQMSIVAIMQIAINTILLKVFCKLPVISIPNIFAFFSLMFHCGQIVKEGFHIEGTVPLPFEYYGDQPTIQSSFLFFVISQTIYFIAVCVMCGKSKGEHGWESNEQLDSQIYAKALMIVGVIPRLYIDFLSLIKARASGYEGVYSTYIPQPVQSIAFFFDAGLLFLLCGQPSTKKQRLYFVVVVVYKCIMMATGARQEKVAFLLIWFYIYFFVLHRITIKRLIVLMIACIAGFMFISAIGTIRTSDTASISQTVALLQSGTMSNVFGSALGEFGAAFNTLEVAIRYTPAQINYGYGRSYIAGILSVVPLLVNRIPMLAEAVIFLNQLPKQITFAFGGSFLGELYYNFSWLGVLGSAVVGAYMLKIHSKITCKGNAFCKAWNAVLATAMLLFVRGYFTDMIQKLVWTYLFICILRKYMEKQRARKDIPC